MFMVQATATGPSSLGVNSIVASPSAMVLVISYAGNMTALLQPGRLPGSKTRRTGTPASALAGANGFDPATVSEVVWARWRKTVVERGLAGEALGRFAPSLKNMTRVIWSTPLEAYTQVSQDLGYGPLEALDPGARGAADISFVAPYVDGLSGMGTYGTGAHSQEEAVDLDSLVVAAQRAAILIYRLTRD